MDKAYAFKARILHLFVKLLARKIVAYGDENVVFWQVWRENLRLFFIIVQKNHFPIAHISRYVSTHQPVSARSVNINFFIHFQPFSHKFTRFCAKNTT